MPGFQSIRFESFYRALPSPAPAPKPSLTQVQLAAKEGCAKNDAHAMSPIEGKAEVIYLTRGFRLLTRNGSARGSEGSRRLWPERCLVVRFDGPLTFADDFLKNFNIGDLYLAPRIHYHPSLLKGARVQRHAGSKRAGHAKRLAFP